MKLHGLFALLLLSVTSSLVGAPALDLSKVRDWTIVTADNALPSEKYAAEEFQGVLEEALGFRLPISTQPPKPSQNIFIGPSEAFQSSPVAFGTDDLGEEGLRIRITPDNIAIAGGRPRGTLYGVYEFMERYLGVRFLTHDHTSIPAREDWRIPCETHQYVPSFTFRWSYYKENSDRPEFAARLRVNTVTHPEKLGGVTRQSLISHTLGHLLPVSKYGKEHPEYFALVDGERKLEMGGGGPEPCVTNPDVIEIVAQNAIKDLEQHPDWKNISVSQNDNAAYCRCDRCEAINQAEGTPMGSHLAFVNAVAERIEKRFPKVKVGTLAYWYTRKTPKTIKPRPNVQIQLCSIECSTLYPLDDPRSVKNRPFCEDMDAWGRVCDDIWIWNYNTNFRYYDLPFPNLRVITPNIRYFLKNKVKGVFMQANGNGNTGELCDLRNYVMARCLWNPELDSWTEAQEFCQLHYGKAAPTMIEYLTYLHDNALRAGYEPTCFPMPFEVGINPGSADTIYAFFQEALQEADNSTVRDRVEKASICAYRAVLEACGQLQFQDGALKVVYPPKYGPVVANYLALTKKHGQTRAEEWEPIDHYYAILEKATGKGYRAGQLENDTWRVTVLAEDNGKAVELYHKPTQTHLLMPPDYRTLRHLAEHLTWSELGTQGYQHADPRAFDLRSEDSALVLTKRLKDGSEVKRRIAFGQDPGVIECRTEIMHRGDAPRKYQFRVRPEFNTGCVTQDSRVLSAYIKDGDWKVFNAGWKGGDGPNRAQLETARGGGYAFYNHRDQFGVQISYDPASFARPGFWWSDTYPQANLDLTTKAVQLEPGQSFAFTYQVQFLQTPPREAVPPTHPASLQWFRDAKLGMFIHWGPVSLRGTEIGWSRGAQVPEAEYDQLYRRFNPTNFDARAWAKLARNMGAKYLVLTSKHHDGFCLWDTKLTDYSIMHTPFGRDVIKELAAACRVEGVVFCTYHSICDWWHPDYPMGSPGGKSRKPSPNMARYNAYLKGQVQELIQNYGPLGIMWFDGEWEEPWTQERGLDLYAHCRRLQDSILVNNRVGKGRQDMEGTTAAGAFPGDYDTPEQRVGNFQNERPWESCITICQQWAWKPNDQLKSLKECVHTLVRTVGGDGNLLLNVGPMPGGEIEPRQVQRLEELGRWVSEYSPSICGTRGGPFKPGAWGASTCRDRTVYLHVLDWGGKETLLLPAIEPKVLRASVLSGGDATVKQTDAGLELTVPAAHRQELDTVIVLTLDQSASTIAPR
ncbi:MAG: DUF4838 domain-containing protein [Verrucomicrobiia bacterium]